MLKLEIKLDENLIIEKGQYSCESIYSTLDKTFSKYGFGKAIEQDGSVVYQGNGLAKDYGNFGRLITSLKDKQWFMDYVTKWLWYNSDDGEDENDYSVEDVLFHYTNKESAA